MKKLLLLSNSTNHGQRYLEHAAAPMRDFLGSAVREVLFVPYAGVTFTPDEYTAKVRSHFEGLDYRLISIHQTSDPAAAIAEAEAIAVGGGNTFHLLNLVYENGLIEPIRDRVNAGIPYMGWSAGSNLACPTIRTTNDMPIMQPPSFDALNLIPFQINPHYLDAHPEKHKGETREDRINEFIEVNRDTYVAGLREGSTLAVKGDTIELLGPKSIRIFKHGEQPAEYQPDQSLSFLLG